MEIITFFSFQYNQLKLNKFVYWKYF